MIVNWLARMDLPFRSQSLEKILSFLVEKNADEVITMRFMISFPHTISLDIMWRCFENMYFPEDEYAFSKISEETKKRALDFLKMWIHTSFKRDFLCFYKEDKESKKRICLRDKVVQMGKKRLDRESLNQIKILMLRECREKLGNRPKRWVRVSSKKDTERVAVYRSNSSGENTPTSGTPKKTVLINPPPNVKKSLVHVYSNTDVMTANRQSVSSEGSERTLSHSSSSERMSDYSDGDAAPNISAKTYFHRTYSKAVIKYNESNEKEQAEKQLMIKYLIQYKLCESILAPTGGFMAEDDMAIAQQLTIIEYEIFVKIDSSEFLKKNWSGEKKQIKAKYICRMVERFNLVSEWIMTVVLQEKNSILRIRRIEKFLSIQRKLFEIHNFSGVMQILGAFNNSAIDRLKKTKKHINWDSFEKFQNIMTHERNYQNYKDHIRGIVKPMVPYMGICTRDCEFIDVIHKNQDNGMINFEKLQMMGRTLCEIQAYQQNTFHFPENLPLKNYLTFLPCLHEDILWKFSIECEPIASPV